MTKKRMARKKCNFFSCREVGGKGERLTYLLAAFSFWMYSWDRTILSVIFFILSLDLRPS